MVDYIRPKDLPAGVGPQPTDLAIPGDNGIEVVRVTPAQIVATGRPIATEAQALAGVDNTTTMTPLTTAQAMDSRLPGVMQPYVDIAQAWAESPTNPDPANMDSKSAKTWAGDAATSAAQAALYNGVWSNSVASLAANTSLTYSAGPGQVIPGQPVMTRRGNFVYITAPLGSTDYDLETAGGVLLYADPGDTGELNTAQFIAGDIGARFNAAIVAAKRLQVNSGSSWVNDLTSIVLEGGTHTPTTTMVLQGVTGLNVFARGTTLRHTMADPILRAVVSANVTVDGLTIDARLNNVALESVLVAGGFSFSAFDDLRIQYGSTNTGYSCVRMIQGNASGPDPNDRDKGNFWVTFLRPWFRKLSGGDPGSAGSLFDLQGCQNAFRCIDGRLNGADIGILVRNQAGSTLSGISNDVQVGYTAFEGTGIGLSLRSTNPLDNVSGGAMVGCRGEAMTAFVESQLTPNFPNQPMTLIGNTIISNVATYILGQQDHFNTYDSSVTPQLAMRVVGSGSAELINLNATTPGLWLRSKQAAVGGVLGIRRGDGTVDTLFSQRPGGGVDWEGGAPGRNRIGGLSALSGSATLRANLRGTVNPTSGTSIYVTFGSAEPDAAYQIMLTGNSDRKLWWSNKATTGFTINTDAAFISGNSVSWLLIG